MEIRLSPTSVTSAASSREMGSNELFVHLLEVTAAGQAFEFQADMYADCDPQAQRYLTDLMLLEAADRGIELVLIDITQPLAAQGPFTAIIHKLTPHAGGLCPAVLVKQRKVDHVP